MTDSDALNDAAPEAACAADTPAAAAAPFASVAVIGLGLIGASLAATLAAKMPGVRVFGVDTDAATCATAKSGVTLAATPPSRRIRRKIPVCAMVRS
jgi:prephenate dehydrogenase